ncbi:MAG TPA: hypothetical protein VKU84_14410 [Stellaceae bacterium]|nr:hypothetical protein [Stellaceae bacterium]
MVPALTAALALVLLAANQPPPPADASPSDGTASAPAPNSAVVGGHHIQPRAAQGNAGFSKQDNDDVDRLYQELMRLTAPDAARAKASISPQ